MPLGTGSMIDSVYKYGESDISGPLFSDFLNLPGDGIRTRLNAGKIADSGWINLTLVNSWVVSLAETPQYRKLNGVVYLRGLITGGSAATVATLPAGYRPVSSIRNVVKAATSASATTTLQIDSSGLITTTVGASPNLGPCAPFPADN